MSRNIEIFSPSFPSEAGNSFIGAKKIRNRENLQKSYRINLLFACKCGMVYADFNKKFHQRGLK